MEQQPGILYIMGTGRTGTTILEVLLTNTPSITGLGEVTKLFRDGFLRNGLCSCGRPFRDCDRWKPVREQFEGASCSDLNSFMETMRFFDWHTHFLAHCANICFEDRFSLYKKINESIYRSMGDAWGGEYLLDSSKYAGRALSLHRSYPGRVKVLCMTRSPQGLIKSFRKKDTGEQKPKSIPDVVAYYSYVLLCCRLVSRRSDMDVLPLRYEDLLNHPIRELERLGGWIGVDLAPTMEKLRKGEPLRVGHILTGNRLRMQKELRFVREPPPEPSTVGEGVASFFMNGVRSFLGF
jgi:hypothetical protein